MMSAQENDLITRIGPGTPCGNLMRRYWQPAALVDELEGERPVKPVRLLGENLVLFKDEQGRYGLLARHCPHRGADLAFGRREDGGLRCAFHGWLFDVTGQCRETPAEPEGSPLCRNIKQPAYPGRRPQRRAVDLHGPRRAAGVPELRLLRGAGPPTPSPSRGCGSATGCRRWRSASTRRTPPTCTASSRTRTGRKGYGKQFRDASTDSDMPMTQLMREHARPRSRSSRPTTACRSSPRATLGNDKTHVRVTNQIFPHAIVHPAEPGDDADAVARAGR